jgi:hypothetical protein
MRGYNYMLFIIELTVADGKESEPEYDDVGVE